MPAGQLKSAAPSGARSAGQSAPLETPAHFFALLIVTGTAKTLGLVRASGLSRLPVRAAQIHANGGACNRFCPNTMTVQWFCARVMPL